MGDHPARARRRIVPDHSQVQIILGSLLGDGRIEGDAGARRLSINERADRERYVWWKYERLAALADDAPESRDGRVSFNTIAHPIFDDIALLLARSERDVVDLLTPLGRAVRRTDALANEGSAVQEASCDQESDLIRER